MLEKIQKIREKVSDLNGQEQSCPQTAVCLSSFEFRIIEVSSV